MLGWLSRSTPDLITKSEPPLGAPTPDPDASLAEPDAYLNYLFGILETATGKAVTPETAIRVPAVACAVRTLAEVVGQIPFHVYRDGPDGGRERDPEHPAHVLVHDDATDWTSAAQFRTKITTDALLHGDGVAYVGRNNDGVPVELYRLKPGSFDITESEIDGGPVYAERSPRQSRILPRANVIHISAFSVDGIRGRSPIAMARESIAVLQVMQEHAGKLFGKGARPAGTLNIPAGVRVDAITRKRMRESWRAYEGSANAGGTPLLEGGTTFNPMAFNSVDSQFLELWTFHVLEVARAFRLPPHLLFELGRATWSNIEDQGRDFLTYSLLPLLNDWKAAYRRALLRPEERGTVHIEPLVDDLMRADLASRAEAYSKLIAARVLNPNECRAMENRPPYEGGGEFENPNTTSGAKTVPEENALPEREHADV